MRRQYPHIRLACGSHFGFEEEIFALLAQRVFEAGCETTRMPCDGCKYRQIAHGHGHAHHHHGPGMP